MSNGWIGVDLDATLATYTGWQGALHIGEPIWPMVERVKQWLREGKDVRVMTARVGKPHPRSQDSQDDIRNFIQDWCEIYIGERLPVTCEKDFAMIELWDDRAVQVEPNVGEPVTYWQSRV